MKKTILFSLLFLLIYQLNAQNIIPSSITEKQKAVQDKKNLQEKSIFKNYPIRSIGPSVMGGRVVDIEGNPKNLSEFYVAYASGGVFKTENNGQDFIPIFDNQHRLTIGDIALFNQNPNIIWVGTGENNSSRSSYAGMGVFKSENGGKTWEFCGLENTQHIGRIITHPTDEKVALVASIGALYSNNAERGVYKTIDGGKTWKKTLFINDSTGIIDMVMHPKKPNLIWAAAWERDRKAYNFKEAGKGSGIYFSEDAGETWKKIEAGKESGRIGLAISQSNPNILYFVLDNQEKIKEDAKDKQNKDANEDMFEAKIKGCEVYKSEDEGKTWKKINHQKLEGVFFTYGYYFGQIRISPKNPDIIYIFGVPLLKSTDGGKTYKSIANFNKIHPDHHALWFNPDNENHFILGNDGGIYQTYNGGKTFAHLNNSPTGQFYSVTADMETPYNVYGGLQDNGTYKGSSKSEPDDNKAWDLLSWGDGMCVQVNPKDSKNYYVGYQFGNYFRKEEGKRLERITPKNKKGEPNLRFNWRTPLIMSSHNSDILYIAAQKVMRSVNRGNQWESISPDLTTQFQPQGNVPFSTISALAESNITFGLLYAGTDDGEVWITKNGGGSWEKITNGLPKSRWVSSIYPSNFKENEVFITLNGYRNDEIKAYIYKSIDFGKNWTLIQGNLPDEAINVVIQDRENEKLLYCGTDEGAYMTFDNGKNWEVLTGKFPNVATYDLFIHPRESELILGTHGRSIFVMDLKPLYRLTEENLKKKVIIYPLDKIKFDKNWGKSEYEYESKTEPQIKITYFLPKDTEQMTLQIKNTENNKVIYQKKFQQQSRGFYTFEWNGEINPNNYIPKGKYIVEIEKEIQELIIN